jgi:hypothetical protein
MDQQLLMDPDVEPAELRPCIDACEHCHRTCLQAATRYCLEQGGRYVEPQQFRLMLGCANVCHLTADALLSALPLYEYVCAVCARICRDCAAGCSDLDEMGECIAALVACARCCEAVASTLGESRMLVTENS